MTNTTWALHVDERGVATGLVEIDKSELTKTGETTTVRGWSYVSGPCDVCKGPRKGDYLVPVGRVTLSSPPWATDKCVACGHKLEDEGEHALCCSHASYDDGKHEDPYCKKCCGPHTPVNPQVEWFPQG